MNWIELSVDVDAEAVESISELLAQYGYNGGVVIDQPIIPGEDGPEYSYDTQRPVTLRTYLPNDEQAPATVTRLEQALWHLGRMRPVSPLRQNVLEEQDWANAWKRYYTIQQLGERTVIVPSWLEYSPRPNDIVIRLDPGMAFGTGLHPTTRLCLLLLERYVRAGQQVLDLGCGSGILSIAAAQLGAAQVLALDTDPIAITATVTNAGLNAVSDYIQAAEGSLPLGVRGQRSGVRSPESQHHTVETQDVVSQQTIKIPGEFDLIVANILARILAGLAMDMVGVLKPGGLLISSGIIAEREDEVALAYAAAGLERVERRQEGDWVALVHRKA